MKSLVLILACTFFCCCNKKEIEIKNPDFPGTPSKEVFVKGISYVATKNPISSEHMAPLKTIHSNYVAIIPFALGRWEQPSLEYDNEHQWWGETEVGVKKSIELAREQGLHVMIKPQIWFWGGKYTGHFRLKTEEEWKTFEDNYRKYMMTFVRIAEETDVELFCIGTELEAFCAERPAFWSELIKEIKSAYKGKLTYAANWDAYRDIPFWKDIDYIGVDAYFPVSQEKEVTLEQAKEGWKPWINQMRALSTNTGKKILLTEIGYRSIAYAGKEPWTTSDGHELNHQNQKVLYTAMFETVWRESFVQGGFIWKWFPDHVNSGGKNHDGFTPQNKLAEEELKYQYSIVKTFTE